MKRDLSERPLTIAVLLGFVALAACILSGCAGGVVYENDNGPRGPERVSIPGMAWPRPLSCDGKVP